MITFDPNHKPSADPVATIEVFAARPLDDWRWHKLSLNGKIVAQGEGHPRRYRALRAAEKVFGAKLVRDTAPIESVVAPHKVVVFDRYGKVEKTGYLY